MCNECMEEAFLNGVYLNGLDSINYEALLSLGAGVSAAALTDFYIDRMATNAEAEGGYMATFQNPYLRQGGIAAVGLGVAAMSENPMLMQFGQGWIAYGVGAMITTFVKGYFIEGLGSPEQVVNIGTPKTTAVIGQNTPMSKSEQYLSKRESPQIMQYSDARLTGVQFESDARLTGAESDARLTGDYSNIKINY